MNTTQLRKLGVPADCLASAIEGIHIAAKQSGLRGNEIKQRISQVIAEPAAHEADPYFSHFARELIESRSFVPTEPIPYQTWGTDIDDACHSQMRHACSLPMAVGAALMPDAHLGYGLPIGGVLALDNAVVPYAVGVDIACRMKLSVLDLPTSQLTDNVHRFRQAIVNGTRFGVGAVHEKPQTHAVMDQDWSVCRVTRENRDRAWRQLGTSGSGNQIGRAHV